MENLLLLSKDEPIAEIIDGGLRPLLFERIPLYLKRTGDAETWLEPRAIEFVNRS